MRTALERLADQVGSSVIFGASHERGPVLPTITCPGNARGDYVTIGFSLAPASAPNG
jgi:hypothetical protein